MSLRSGESAAPSVSTPSTSSVQDLGEAGAEGDRARSSLTAELLDRIHASHDESARERLREQVVLANTGVARAIAFRYRQRGLSLDDLVQVAYVGLVKAVNGFDPAHERDFLSYAVPTISGEVKRYFRDFGWTVRPPRRVQELQSRIGAVTHDLSQQLGRSPRPGEVAEALDVDVETVIEALAAVGCFNPSSLDVPVGEDGSASLGQLLPHPREDFHSAEARVMLAPALRRLGERDKRILELRFFHGWTQEQIAADIGVTQMQISRLLSRIFTDLRTTLTSDTTPRTP
ncbi:MAG: sigma-70 family RNA polymerase sigma factor [Nocardioidaceae bacterium]